MGFFKNILSSVVGDEVADSLTGEFVKSTSRYAMGVASEKATEKAVEAAVSSATASLNRPSPLDTPCPPAIPEIQKTMSVMVAVNGQSYGPYERATLLEMIANGSLTKDTYVFQQGMRNWQIASSVPEVSILFNENTALPDIPPIPWANAKTNTVENSSTYNSFSQKLNQLINAAVADGEISDLERQVLIRNAQEEGVSMDEFVMVLEARLYEQKRILQAQEDEKIHKQRIIEVQQVAANVTSKSVASDIVLKKRLNKCPACGAPVQPLTSQCPECGMAYVNEVDNSSAWQKLSEKLEDVDSKDQDSILKGVFAGVYSPKIEKKIQIISTFPIPGTKADIVEFFAGCAPLSKASKFSASSIEELKLAPIYKKKAQQTLLKARIVLKDDPELLMQIETLAKEYKIKA